MSGTGTGSRAGAGGKSGEEATRPAGAPPGAATVPLNAFELPFWEVREFLPAKRAYNEVLAYRVEAELDPDRCRAVLERMVEAHPALRTAFVEGPGGVPAKRALSVTEIGPLPVEEQDFSGEEEPLAACRARAAALARTDFPLETPPLFHAFAWRVAPARWVVGCVIYHIVVDLWSVQLLAQEAARRYAADDAAPSQAGGAQETGAQDLLPRWCPADAAFWRKQLAGRPEPLAFPARPRRAIKSYRGNLAQRTLRHSYVGEIEPARRALHVTAASLTFAAFGLLLAAVADAEELVVGVPHLLRDEPGAQHVVGVFLNTLPVRLSLPGSLSTGDFVRAAHAQLWTAISHAGYPVQLMQAEAGVAPTLSRAPLYDHLFTYYDGLGDPAAEGRGATELHLSPGTSKLDLSCFVRRQGDSLLCRFEYSTDLFSADEAEQLLGLYERTLDLLLGAPLMRLADAKASIGSGAVGGARDAGA
jgi:hypothetical protein